VYSSSQSVCCRKDMARRISTLVVGHLLGGYVVELAVSYQGRNESHV
jgi:hypothetical protein